MEKWMDEEGLKRSEGDWNKIKKGKVYVEKDLGEEKKKELYVREE
jgi:hypothetical protein